MAAGSQQKHVKQHTSTRRGADKPRRHGELTQRADALHLTSSAELPPVVAVETAHAAAVVGRGT
jgi:hypothetical protein